MLFGICSTIAHYETVKNAGYSAIGIAGKDVAAMSDSEFTQACGIIKAGSMRLSHFYAFCAPSVVLAGANYDTQDLRQYTEKLFARGKELGVCYAGIGSPLSRVRPEGVSTEQMDAQMTDTLKLLGEIGDKYGIEILLEAVCVQSSCNYITGTEDVLKMISALPGINMVYDIYHAYMMNEDAAPILKAGPRIRIAHLSGNIGETRGYLTKQNVLDYQPYVDALKKTGYAGELHIEASSGDVAQEAAPSLDVLRTLYGK